MYSFLLQSPACVPNMIHKHGTATLNSEGLAKMMTERSHPISKQEISYFQTGFWSKFTFEINLSSWWIFTDCEGSFAHMEAVQSTLLWGLNLAFSKQESN